MKRDNSATASVGLPYINNLRLILITVGVNLAMGFAFHFWHEIKLINFIADAALCGFFSTAVVVVFASLEINKRRSRGALPSAVPESRLLMRLPKNPIALTALLGVIAAIFMALASYAIAWFFEINVFTFPRFIVWKAVYSLVLNAKITELVILRLVQSDCAKPDSPVQTGAETVRNPLPRKDKFIGMFDTMINDFGFNIVTGLILGGCAVVADKSVVIYPTTRSGIVIGGLILGVIVSFRMVAAIAKAICAVRDAGGIPALERRSAWVSWIPEKPIFFALALMPIIMIASAAVLWAVLTFFGFETLSFFQFFVVRTVYVTLLSKPVTWLAVLRYRQPKRVKASSDAAI